jgi:hypothetical protein
MNQVLYEGDFVSVDHYDHDSEMVGEIVKKRMAADVVTAYEVQMWSGRGPTPLVNIYCPPEVSLHEHGRMTVIDNTSQKKFNNR